MQKYFFNKANNEFNNGMFENAANNYLTGIDCEITNVNNIFLIRDAYIKLCQCYWNLGQYGFSQYYNSLALKIDPNNEFAIANSKLFPIIEKLNIVVIAPNNKVTVPPVKYGGIERVVYDLVESLIEDGHDVYLFADKGSTTRATLIGYDENMTTYDFVLENFPRHRNIDIIHDHSTEFKNYVSYNKINFRCPFVYTYHFHDNFTGYLNENCNVIFPTKIAINGKSLTNSVIHHGINIDDYECCKKEDYLLFMGAIYKGKGIKDAIKIAEKTNSKLKIAGPVFPENVEYYNEFVKPHLTDKIEYIGEVGGDERKKLFAKAKAMLFPIHHKESFGLVMIESMASGTPVIAYNISTVNEIIGKFSDCIGDTIEDLIDIVNKEKFPTSDELINYVKENFSSQLMAKNHINYYKSLLEVK